MAYSRTCMCKLCKRVGAVNRYELWKWRRIRRLDSKMVLRKEIVCYTDSGSTNGRSGDSESLNHGSNP
jgi:hypothetical protein